MKKDSNRWSHLLEFDGETFSAEILDGSYSKRAGVQQIFAINGLPDRFRKDLIISSQVCDVPHTWRVKECGTVTEVDSQTLAKGSEALEVDMRERGAHVICYLGEDNKKSLTFLAAGAIRNKLSKTFFHEEFPVVSRAIVAPEHRGRGLGSMIVHHRFEAVLNFFSKKPKAIHFGTESEKILHSLAQVEKKVGFQYVHIGNEQYQTTDGVHTVADYLGFLPWYKEALLNAVTLLARNAGNADGFDEFQKDLKLFMNFGVAKVSGRNLETRFSQLKASLDFNQEEALQLKLLEELFIVKREIGAVDPV